MKIAQGESAEPGSPATGLRRWGGAADAALGKRSTVCLAPRRGAATSMHRLKTDSYECPQPDQLRYPQIASLLH